MSEKIVLEVLDDFASPESHTAAWTTCSGKGWYFGHGSHADDDLPFWKMDLEQQPAFAALWEQARARCEQLAGTRLRVIRVYANGHTYGLGGHPHVDDGRPGTYTLLYYPMLEWKSGWDGETVFYEGNEVILSVVPKPNRAVFFDSRILHAGRAPSRACPALRVTVAYKLEAVDAVPSSGIDEIGAEGSLHRFHVRIPAREIDARIEEHLKTLAKSVKLPGFRPGKIPMNVLRERYGSAARRDVLTRAGIEAANRATPKGGLVSNVRGLEGAESGDAVFEISVTILSDLPDPDFSTIELVRLTSDHPEDAAPCADHLKQQVLDALAEKYPFPIAPALVEREFQPLWQSAQPQLAGVSAEERQAAEAEFRSIAERRIRLGAVVLEIARRQGIDGQGAALENAVVDRLTAQARVTHRAAAPEDLARFR